MTSDSQRVGRILVAVDFSASSRAALIQAIALGTRSESPVEVLHVVQGELAFAQAIMPEFLSTISVPPNVALAVRYETGAPSATIVMVAANEAHDVIVIGSHGWSMRWSVRLGEVAEEVVAHAPCPVITVQRSTGQDEDTVLPWLPRNPASTQSTSIPITEPLFDVDFHCPQTGEHTSMVACLQCPRLVAAALSTGTRSLELICTRRRGST